MLRRLPPLNAIKAFEAAARSESFTRAAEELNVTHGAVSHQVKALESTLGIRLFNRERQRLVITEAGREYLAVVRDALDRIAAGTQRLVERQSSGVLTISTSPDFAANGSYTDSVGLRSVIRRSICGSRQRCITSTLHARTSMLLSAMVMASGLDSRSCVSVPSGSFPFAAPSLSRDAIA